MARKDQHGPFRELLAARLDRPLTRVESHALTTHLKSCASCQQADAEYRAQRVQLRALSQPPPPRDMWARTSAALDREVARGARTAWSRRARRARRKAAPTSALISTIAAVGVITALAVFQLAPAMSPAPNPEIEPTPFAVDPQPFAFVGLGTDNLAIYRMTVSQVCPQTATLDCVPAHKIVRTPIGFDLADDIQPGNAALSPTGDQLVLVGKQRDSDVIAVVMMPGPDGSFVNPTKSVGLPESTETPVVAAATPAPPSPSPQPTPSSPPSATPDASPDPDASPTLAAPTNIGPPSREPIDPGTATPVPTPETTDEPAPTPTSVATEPSTGAIRGLAVVNILDDVRSTGAPPAWSRNGQMLAFSAMPVDGSHGPDVYIWSPSDTVALPITTDHNSYFASWSGDRIVVSRVSVGSDDEIVSRNYVIDPGTLEQRRVRSGQVWLPAVNRQRTQAVVWQGELGIHDGHAELVSGGLFLMPWSSIDPFREADAAESSPRSDATPRAVLEPPSLVPLDPDRNLGSASVADWQAGWSPDGRVLGIWTAESVGSAWGSLTVLAIDPTTGAVADGDPLLQATLARRGFSLGVDRVAWVAPSSSNVEGELRLRAWTSDGVGGLRVISPQQEEVLPAF